MAAAEPPAPALSPVKLTAAFAASDKAVRVEKGEEVLGAVRALLNTTEERIDALEMLLEDKDGELEALRVKLDGATLAATAGPAAAKLKERNDAVAAMRIKIGLGLTPPITQLGDSEADYSKFRNKMTKAGWGASALAAKCYEEGTLLASAVKVKPAAAAESVASPK